MEVIQPFQQLQLQVVVTQASQEVLVEVGDGLEQQEVRVIHHQ
jgi:hypothetical protein